MISFFFVSNILVFLFFSIHYLSLQQLNEIQPLCMLIIIIVITNYLVGIRAYLIQPDGMFS
mgnify:CR=1 FL=1